MRQLSVAIAGCGVGAEHLAGYLENRSLFKVVAVCDPDEQRAAPLVAQARCDYLPSYEAALERRDVELLDVCLPPGMHKSAIFAGLDAGKHVLCEKPLVTSLAEFDEIAARANGSDRLVLPIFQYRFGNGLGQLRELMAHGLAGEPLVASLETHWRRDSSYYETPWRGNWSTEFGGSVVTHAIHINDLLAQVFGPIESVQANLATRVNSIEVDDCAALSLRMVNGALATSSVTMGHYRDESRLRFVFDKLSAQSPTGVDPYNPGSGPWSFRARNTADQRAIDDLVAAYQAARRRLRATVRAGASRDCARGARSSDVD